MKKIGKLVRDNIPNIIKADGKKPITRKLNDEEFLKELDRKLVEEQNEFQEAHDKEELADILELVYAYCNYLDISFDDLEKLRRSKNQKNGGFSEAIYLEGVE